MDPEKLNKYLYIEKTPTWLVRGVYALGIIVWLPVVIQTWKAVGTHPFFTWFVAPIVGILTLHYYASFFLNLFYRQFDLQKHSQLLTRFWRFNPEPSVDVYLPICGEEMSVLANTWKYVSRLDYANKRVYVLDDSKDECVEHKKLAETFGFTYFERPNKGEMKKAGNLKYAYARTQGEFIAILDADFTPRSDYLRELLPYMSEQKVGIVQSPQYFLATKEIHDQGPLAYGGARAQEIFYRIIQVARDRLGGAHCCGTCAIYRRAALASIGGFVQIGHSEDAHTGFTLTAGGWTVRYVPLIVSVGLSPDDPHMFFHQQHRWCLGNIMMMLDKKFWTAPVPWRIKYCYITGFLFYLHQPLLLIFSFQLFWILFFYNDYISFLAGLPFYPHTIWAFSFMIFFYITPLRWGYLYAILLRMYAYCHAVMTEILGGTVGWIPTNSKQVGVSTAFRQMVIAASIYTFLNLALVALAARMGMLHLFDYDYYTVEFWIFYNLILSSMILWHLYLTMERAERKQVASGGKTKRMLQEWKLKTVGAYTMCTAGMFLTILYLPSSLTANESSTYGVTPYTQIALQQSGAHATIASPAAFGRTSPSRLPSFVLDRYINDEAVDILALQQFLNARGFTVRAEGLGSEGNETSYFGPYTQLALLRFQRANDLPEQGYLGPLTRRLINDQQ